MGQISLYRNISLTFIIFVAMLLAALCLFLYSQATIIVKVNEQQINLNFTAEAKAQPTADEIQNHNVITGSFQTVNVQASSTFAVSSTKALSSNLVGEIKLINNSARNQALLKTTQLQAASGVIVRTNEEIVVPANGSVRVGVYPKDPAAFSKVAPGKLVIIKLAPALQPEIYGLAETELSTDIKEVKVLAQSDINKAKAELIDQALADYKKDNNLGANTLVFAEASNLKTDKKIGANTDNFRLSADLKIKILQVDAKQIVALIERQAEKLSLAGTVVATIDVNKIKYTLLDTNTNGTLTVKVEYSLTSTLTADNPILGKKNFTGKTIAEVKAYAKDQPAIKELEVYLSPSWRKTLPDKENRIKMIIQ